MTTFLTFAAYHGIVARGRKTMSNDSPSSDRPVIVAPDADLRALFNLPDNAVIRFDTSGVTGLESEPNQPILALNPRFNNMTASSDHLRHSLVQDRYFYTLPAELWSRVKESVGSDRFDPELVSLEESLGRMCGDHSSSVGFWRGRSLTCFNLRSPPSLTISAVDVPEWKVNQAAIDLALRNSRRPLENIARVTRAYLGWLLTNRTFLDEHDSLLRDWQSDVALWGTSSLGQPVPPHEVPDNETARSEWSSFNAAFEPFFHRWRLRGLAGPYLPIPLQPSMAGRVPQSTLQQLARAGGVFCIPDTFPIPSRDELRSLLVNALHNTDSTDHLTEWMQAIASDNTARHALDPFERYWELQHYWRILHHRHVAAFRRQVTHVKEALAEFMGTSERRLHVDLIELRKRLGTDWLERSIGTGWEPFG
ncbi:MAG: hypothetical protein JNM18_03505 [Planctomycetaceae bacterium]|nr:hypothetical protein [Planctomycetaceae bacterium]